MGNSCSAKAAKSGDPPVAMPKLDREQLKQAYEELKTYISSKNCKGVSVQFIVCATVR